MSAGFAIAYSLAVCAGAAALEGICAGRTVKKFFSELRFPRFSPPLWVWSIIGGAYYVIFGFALFRLLRRGVGGSLAVFAVALIIWMMLLNALANYVIFRARNLYLAFVAGAIFPIFDIALLLCLFRLDNPAAWSLFPYMAYRLYAIWWGYSVWRINHSP